MIHKNLIVKKIKLKGRGLFTTEKIKKGEKVITFDGHIMSFEQAQAIGREDYVVPISSDQYTDPAYPEEYTNHSCEANTGFISPTTLIAIRDINPDEELTFDYSLVTADDWEMDCQCSTQSCRGKITNFRDLPEDTKRELAPYAPKWILDLENKPK